MGSLLADDGFLEKGLEHLQQAVDLDRDQDHGAVDANFLKKLQEVKRRYTASTRPVTSP
jgi:hypothetical protein